MLPGTSVPVNKQTVPNFQIRGPVSLVCSKIKSEHMLNPMLKVPVFVLFLTFIKSYRLCLP
jgi:hypothetical protein